MDKPAIDGEGRNVVAADDAHVIFDYTSPPWVDERPGVPETEIIKAITSESLSGT